MGIEADRVEILAGIRHGRTLGSPICLLVPNRDAANWGEVMNPAPLPDGLEEAGDRGRPSRRPRPGHADLTGALKYGHTDLRDVLERASARTTAAVVAAGAVARRFLAELGIVCGSHVVAVGGVRAAVGQVTPEALAGCDERPLRCLDTAAEEEMCRAIDEAGAAGDTLGGVFEVVAFGLPPGLGSYTTQEERLDSRLAAAVMSIPAVKGVEIGDGFAVAEVRGSSAHDVILPGGRRATNRAGGLEGGMTDGETLVVRGAMKPIATLREPLATIDLDTGGAAAADFHRSDVCAVPAAGVVAEAEVMLVLAGAMSAKFGGDSLAEVRRALSAYHEEVRRCLTPTSY